VPLVVRLEGTNVDLGKKILAESALPIISAGNMADAAEKAVRAAGSASAATVRSTVAAAAAAAAGEA
ncbi:MAG: succinate--CoA ligase subunit beta, partial [Nitrosospira sp.]|nr:succinate--CoA ligase subunit beta [Nitrosospira sp.]